MTRAALAVLLVCVGCARSSQTIDLLPPFSDDTVIGQLTATWDGGGETRVSAQTGAREHQVRYRVDASNRLSNPMYLRLSDFHLITAGGESPGAAPPAPCTLAPGQTRALLAGEVWLPADTAIRGVRVERFAVPLSERGRAFYREFLLLQRPDASAAIDAELAAYSAAPPCHALE